MPLDKNKIIELVKSAISIRNAVQSAVADGEHTLKIPAKAETKDAPATTASEKETGQLVNAAGFAHALAVQLVNHLEHIAPDAIKEAQKIIETKPEVKPAGEKK